MKSSEALKKLVGKTGIINDTCGSLEDCIKGCKCRFNEPKKECDDYNLVMTIKQDLKRLEKLEKVIDILKDKFNLKVQILVFYDNREEYHLELQSHRTEYSFPISKDLYELLKEVLEDE